MSNRIIVNGAHGKMGRLACQTIDEHPGFLLVGALTKADNLAKSIQAMHADIVIDLTRADSVYTNSLTIIAEGAHPIIGTSGLSPEQITHLQILSTEKQLGGIIVPNFSLAAVLMMQFASQAARYLPDVEIIEMHHPQKFDAPSGTAIKTAAMIEAQRRAPAGCASDLPSRGIQHHGVAIHALRLPGILAKQQVIFGATGETLTLSHETIDRSCFMPGLVLCCQRVRQLTTLYYGLEQLL